MSIESKDIRWSANPVMQRCFTILFQTDTIVDKYDDKKSCYYVVKFDNKHRSFVVTKDYLLIKTENPFYAGTYYYDDTYAGFSCVDGVKLYQKCKDVYENPVEARESVLRQEQNRIESFHANLAYLDNVSDKHDNFIKRLLGRFISK